MSANTSAIFWANGRALMTRSWARRSFEADTIFIALVICCVFFTDLMRRRMSKRLAINDLRYGGLRPLSPHFLEIGQRLVQIFFDVISHSFLITQILQHGGMRVLDKAQQLSFIRAHISHRYVVGVTIVSGP